MTNEAQPGPFKDVPMNEEDSWRRVQELADNAIYKCGHPHGGCPRHCDVFVKIHQIAIDRIFAND